MQKSLYKKWRQILVSEELCALLDEATSALDMATEKDVMEAINALQGDKTVLIVAHRLSTVANCNWVYRMEQGRVVEAGRFEDLSHPAAAVVLS